MFYEMLPVQVGNTESFGDLSGGYLSPGLLVELRARTSEDGPILELSARTLRMGRS